MTRETVFFETSARRAMSLMVARLPRGAWMRGCAGVPVSATAGTLAAPDNFVFGMTGCRPFVSGTLETRERQSTRRRGWTKAPRHP